MNLPNRLAAFAACALLLTGCSTKTEPVKGDEATTLSSATNIAASGADSTPVLSKEQMEQAWEKAMTPGESHKLLNDLAGKWKAESKFWTTPGAPPEVTSGTALNKWKYNGRFLEGSYSGKWNGKPFQGVGVWGFDNVTGKYQSTWFDSMSTQIVTTTGSYDPLTRAITLAGEASCPISGKPMPTRQVTTIVGPNKHIFEMYGTAPDGKEFKAVEITYTRVPTPTAKPAS